MTKFEHVMSTTFWVYWFICSAAMSIVISDGIFMAFAGLAPLFGVVSVWLAQHVWIFATMWIILTVAKIAKLFIY